MRTNTVSRLTIKAHTLLGFLILLPCSALAQDDSAFLACEPIEARSERLACLEAALEAATNEQQAPLPSPATNAAVEEFGTPEPRVTKNTAGNEELHDTIANLKALRPNQWRIELTSGQVWFQVHAKRFNLRAGDPVRIYPTNWGENYRLDSDNLNGFIQVQRLE